MGAISSSAFSVHEGDVIVAVRTVRLQCDRCGFVSRTSTDDARVLMRKMRSLGWSTGRRDLCASCRRKRRADCKRTCA